MQPYSDVSYCEDSDEEYSDDSDDSEDSNGRIWRKKIKWMNLFLEKIRKKW